ncbi:hypothetical protein P3G55_16950 [Leptospira sp. 96542]|nr:hypothetical protein [Leptospira sp. 96542]
MIGSKTAGILSIIAVSLLFIWWISMGFFLPTSTDNFSFSKLILSPNWVIINLIGLFGAMVWPFAYIGLYHCILPISNIVSRLGFYFGMIGINLFFAIQFCQTFVWPIIAKTNPTLVELGGELVVGNLLVVVPIITSGVLLGLGYFLTYLEMSRRMFFNAGVRITLFLGVLLFANGILIPIRTLGLFMLTFASLSIGIMLLKNKEL